MLKVTRDNLSDVMEFDHVIQVHEDGSVTDGVPDVWAPSLYDDEVDDARWTLMRGYTGQYGYSGPIMHSSEYIGGLMADDILSTPGYYVALVNYNSDDDEGEPEGWAVAYRPA